MKKAVVVLALLAVIGIANADMVVDGATFVPTNGWVNAGLAGPWEWGSGWGVPDIRANFIGGNLTMQTNIVSTKTDGSDPYWVPGNVYMESLAYTETYGLKGQNVTFNFVVGSNNLAGALDGKGNPIVVEAFIKTLDAFASWATTQVIYETCTVGAHSMTLYNVDPSLANPGVQVGFRVVGTNDTADSATGGLGMVIVPEPISIALLGLGGLFLRRRK